MSRRISFAGVGIRDARIAVLFAVLFGLVVWRPALAASPHCRDVEFLGAAGDASQDKVKFRVRDSTGKLLDESCLIQVKGGESGIDFGKRIPWAWGTAGGLTCPSTPQPKSLPKKTCALGATADYSCTHQFVYKPGKKATDPPRKKFLRICCFESNNCKGATLGHKTGKPARNHCMVGKVASCTVDLNCDSPGKSDGLCVDGICIKGLGACKQDADCDTGTGSGDGRCGRRPITIQTKVESLPYTPATSELPFAGGLTLVSIDPIGMVQRPPPPQTVKPCRSGLRSATKDLATTTAGALASCYLHVMNGDSNYDGVDCNTVDSSPNLKPFQNIAASLNDLHNFISTSCEPTGPPLRQGFKSCPAPYDDIPLNTCSAGKTATACTSNADCDTSVGSGDGRCGQASDWGSVADCIASLSNDAVTTAVADKYGSAGLMDRPECIKCQDGIGQAFTNLVGGSLGAIMNCQSAVDSGAASLPTPGWCTAGNTVPCAMDSDCDTAQASGDGMCDPDTGRCCDPDTGLCDGSRCQVDASCDTVKASRDGRCSPDGVCIAGGILCGSNDDCGTNGNGKCGPAGTCTAGDGLCANDGDCDSTHASGDGVCAPAICIAGNTGSPCLSNEDCGGDGICGPRACTAPVNHAGLPCLNNQECDSDQPSGDGRCTAAYCKYVDLNKQRVNAEHAARSSIGISDPPDTGACFIDDGQGGQTDLVADCGLDTCGSVGDVDSVGDCVVSDARGVAAELVDAIIPEGLGH